MTLRVGIVGVGWGTIVHAPAFQAVDGYEVVALCSRTPEKVAKAAESLGITDTSNDWESFVRRDDLDLISVTPPVTLHRDVAVAALEAGKHVLCEKPLALTASECEEMVAAARKAGTQTATCFELRWTAERSKVRALVSDGVVGRPYFVRLSQSGSYWHPSRKNQNLWMYDVDAGGGYLMGMLAHDIDFVASLFGRPVEVCADVRTMVPTRPLPDGGTLDVTADDTTVLILRLETGALALINASVVGVHASGASFDAFGVDGTIQGPLGSRAHADHLMAGRVADAGLQAVPVDDRPLASGAPLPERGAAAMIRAQALMLEDWLPAFSGGTPLQPIPSFEDGLMVARVVEAARASAAGEGWVPIAPV
jgi:predicted dehydrogenase